MAFQNEVDDEVEFLLAPFRDIVSKAKDAAENAGDEQPSMRKAAETLCKEGQRALNRLEPLCSNIASQHGVTFTRAVRSNGNSGAIQHRCCSYRLTRLSLQRTLAITTWSLQIFSGASTTT